MATTFQRLNAPERSLEPRQFSVMTETGRPALCCPSCARVFALPAGHGVDRGGLVIGGYVNCPRQHCGWRDYVHLDSFWESA